MTTNVADDYDCPDVYDYECRSYMATDVADDYECRDLDNDECRSHDDECAAELFECPGFPGYHEHPESPGTPECLKCPTFHESNVLVFAFCFPFPMIPDIEHSIFI